MLGLVLNDFINHSTLSTYKYVDTSKYDIVEKKESKKERLKNELEQLKRQVIQNEESINILYDAISQHKGVIEKLSKEIKTAEKELAQL